MTIEQLRYFLASAKHLNFSRAAEALFIHQTTLSRSIAALEDEIGTPLFIRMKYSLQLTTVGILLRDKAQALIESYDLMKTEVTSAARGVSGHLTLLSPPIYFQLLSRPYSDFLAQYPHVEVSVDICPIPKMDSVCQSVLSRDVDVAIAFSQNIPDKSLDLEFYKFSKERPCLLVPHHHHLARHDIISLSEIRNTNLFVSASGTHFIETLYSAAVLDDTVNILRAPNYEAILLQVTSGNNIGVMPSCLSIANSITNTSYKCVLLKESIFDFDLLLTWRKDNNNPLLKPFVDKAHNYRADYIQPWDTDEYYEYSIEKLLNRLQL